MESGEIKLIWSEKTISILSFVLTTIILAVSICVIPSVTICVMDSRTILPVARIFLVPVEVIYMLFLYFHLDDDLYMILEKIDVFISEKRQKHSEPQQPEAEAETETAEDEELKKQIIDDLKENENGKINTVAVQYNYKVGYAKAVRVLDALASDGILSEHKYYMLAAEPVNYDDEDE